jgi:outer membrane receptor protein involved in Fe transport
LPESADTLTAGLVWTPGAIYGLTVSTDYFDMEIEDTIGNISPINVCFDESNTSNIFCDLATRDATGNVSRVVSLVQNRGLQAARGVDTQVRYATELPDAAALLEDGAQLRLQSIWTHMLSYKTQENPVTETYSCTGYFGYPCSAVGINSFPENRVLTTADYSSGAFSAQLTWQWIEGMLNAAPFVSADFGYPEPDLAIPDVPDYHYFDLGLGWAFESSLTLRLVVNNLFDKDPPNMADQSPAQNTDTGLYDVFGRSYFISLAWEPGR